MSPQRAQGLLEALIATEGGTVDEETDRNLWVALGERADTLITPDLVQRGVGAANEYFWRCDPHMAALVATHRLDQDEAQERLELLQQDNGATIKLGEQRDAWVEALERHVDGYEDV